MRMNKFEISFNNYDHSFCESNNYSSEVEYINSTSALFISLIGMFGVYFNKTDINSSMFYYCLIVNGITSSIYHHTHSIGWGLLDRYSMIYLAAYCYNMLINPIIRYYPKTSHLIRINIIIYLSVLSTYTGLHNENMFNNLFGLFLVSAIAFIMFLIRVYNINKMLVCYSVKGILLIGLGGTCWIITENLCFQYAVMKYLMGHALWHVLVSLGGYYISLIPVYLALTNTETLVPIIKYKYGLPYITDK